MTTRKIIVGAGPVGAVLALAAGRRGFRVVLLEAVESAEDAPRGLMGDVLARYFDFWDRPTRSLVARLDHEVLRNDTRIRS